MAIYQDIKLTVDVAVLSIEDNSASILLVRRKNDPFKRQWVLPGGFVDTGENLEEAAIRELKEETSLKMNSLEQFKAFGDPGRDPRGHTVTVVFLGRVYQGEVTVRASSDAAEVGWHNINHLPMLGFDHSAIIKELISDQLAIKKRR